MIALANGGESKSALLVVCHEALRELILISREFGVLLGELNQTDGTKYGDLRRQRTLIKLESLDQFYQQIIEVAANKCQEEGRIFDALLLYQLCCDYDTVCFFD